MSSISSAGGSSLIQWLQLQQVNSQNQTTTAPPTPPVPGQDPESDTTDGSSSAAAGAAGSGHKHHGHHHGVSSQLESAITTALGSAGSSANPNQVIQDTIKQFLQGGPSASGTNGTGSTASNPANPTATNPATPSVTDPDPTSQQAAFSQLLTANGIDPQQFQQDLHSALQDSSSNGGSVDCAKLFQNFPPGSAVNVLA